MLLTVRSAHIVCLLFVTACASSASGQLSPQPDGHVDLEPGSPSETEVTVSARQVRIAFPGDTSGTWGWPARSGSSRNGAYSWAVHLGGVDGPERIQLWVVQRDSAARKFPTLADLVGEGRASVCKLGMWMVRDCDEEAVSGLVEHNRVVLRLEDSAVIARLFGMRPPEVTAYRGSPGTPYSYPGTSITVRYVDPQIPAPDSVTRADSVLGWRRYEERVTGISRYIDGPGASWSQLWMAVGDTSNLHIVETKCHYDVCSPFGRVLVDSGWSVQDTSILRLDSQCAEIRDAPTPFGSDHDCVIYALRIGRTTVGVSGVHGPSDTAASRSPPATELERTIVVGPPLSRIVITSRPDTVTLGEPVEFQVEALDRAGRPVTGVPIWLTANLGRYDQVRDATQGATFQFEEPGLRRVVASFGELADTIHVMVVDSEE